MILKVSRIKLISDKLSVSKSISEVMEQVDSIKSISDVELNQCQTLYTARKNQLSEAKQDGKSIR